LFSSVVLVTCAQCLPFPLLPSPSPPPPSPAPSPRRGLLEGEEDFIEQIILALDSLGHGRICRCSGRDWSAQRAAGPLDGSGASNEAWDALPECLKAALAAPQPLRNDTLRRLLKTLLSSPAPLDVRPVRGPPKRGPGPSHLARQLRSLRTPNFPPSPVASKWCSRRTLEIMTDPGYIRLPQPEKQVCFQGVPDDGSPLACIILADAENTSMLITM